MRRVLKIITGIIFIGSLTSFVKIGGKEKPVPFVEAEFVGWVTSDYFSIDVKISLVNNSPDTIYYAAQTLYAQDVFKTNSNMLKAVIEKRRNNPLKVFYIPPKGSRLQVITFNKSGGPTPDISKSEKESLIGYKFKVGFIFKRVHGVHNLNADGLEKVLWSNEVEIAKD